MDKDTILLFSVFLPGGKYDSSWVGKESLSYDLTDTVTNCNIKRYTKNIFSDEKKQIIEYASIYEITPLSESEKPHEQAQKEVYEDRIIYRYYYPEQIKQLLTDNNFSIINEYRTDTDIFFEVKLI